MNGKTSNRRTASLFHLIRGVAVTCALALAGCVGIVAAQGTYRIGDAYTVQLDRVWSDATTLMSANPRHVMFFTRNGWALDRLYMTNGLPVGQALVSEVSRNQRRTDDKQVPLVRAGMSELELVEFVADSMAFWDMQQIQTDEVRPASFGPHEGVAFDISARRPNGLDMKATGVAAQAGDKVYLLLFISTREHYFDTLKADVDRIAASVRFP